MSSAQFDNLLARKLNKFLPLSRDEFNSLANLQVARVRVRRGKQLTQESDHKV